MQYAFVVQFSFLVIQFSFLPNAVRLHIYISIVPHLGNYVTIVPHLDNEADKESSKRANNTVLSVIEFYLKLIVVEHPYG